MVCLLAIVPFSFLLTEYFKYRGSYDPYGPARAFTAKLLKKIPDGASRAEKSRPALLACSSLRDANWNNFVAI